MKRAYRPLQLPVLQMNSLDNHYQYREYEPCMLLRPYVSCYWTLDIRASCAPDRHRVIPDGCVDIIIDLNAASSFVVGIMTGCETPALAADSSLFGIRFYVEGARRFIRYPAAELAGQQVSLEALWGNEAAFFLEQVIESKETARLIKRVENKLLQALLRWESDSRSDSWSDRLVQSGIRCMHASQGVLSVRELVEQLSYSERNIRRIFQKELGVGPKKLLDILRFQYILQRLNDDSSARLTDIALAYGYSDQPHFTADFKRFYGLPPKRVFS